MLSGVFLGRVNDSFQQHYICTCKKKTCNIRSISGVTPYKGDMQPSHTHTSVFAVFLLSHFYYFLFLNQTLCAFSIALN